MNIQSIPQEEQNRLKQTASNIGCYDSMKPVFDLIDDGNVGKGLELCETIIQGYKDHPKKYEMGIHFWHILYDNLTKKHTAPIFSVPTAEINDLTSYFLSDDAKGK